MTRRHPRTAAVSATLAGTMLVAVVLGCASRRDDPSSRATGGSGPPQLASSSMPPVELAERVQRVLRREVGEAVRVGYVGESAGGSVRVLGADTAGLRAGAALLFLDAERRPIAYGTILDVSLEGVMARYDAALVHHGRSPRAGDLAAFNLGETVPRPPSAAGCSPGTMDLP